MKGIDLEEFFKLKIERAKQDLLVVKQVEKYLEQNDGILPPVLYVPAWNARSEAVQIQVNISKWLKDNGIHVEVKQFMVEGKS